MPRQGHCFREASVYLWTDKSEAVRLDEGWVQEQRTDRNSAWTICKPFLMFLKRLMSGHSPFTWITDWEVERETESDDASLVCTKAVNCRLIDCSRRMINWNRCTPGLILTVEPIFSLQVNAPFKWWSDYPRTIGSGKTFACSSCMCSVDSPSLAINQSIIQCPNLN